ncbi:MAG: zinc-binding protein, partial [Proteobacteria bacterium]|nr:zinc-binding protein [Pseudomonadota bacterium]
MLNILDLLREMNITPRKVTSTEWASRCPGCGGEDKPGDPSDRFRTWPDGHAGGNAWCRGCEWKGDNIQFCRDFLNLDFKDACDHVGRAADKSVSTPRQVRAPSSPKVYEPVRPGLPSAIWLQRAAELVDWAHRMLLANPEQLSYLAGRGISLEGVRRFRLGWNPGQKGQDIYRPRA